MAANDTSITLDIGASGPDDQSKNDILMNMIRQQKETLEERDKSINELLDKIERDRKTIAAQVKEIAELKLNLQRLSTERSVEAPPILTISSAEGNTSSQECASPIRSPGGRNQSLARMSEQLREKNLELSTKVSHQQDLLTANKAALERYAQDNAEQRREKDAIKSRLDELTIQFEELQRNRQNVDDRLVKMRTESQQQRTKLTERIEADSKTFQEERSKLQAEFALAKTMMMNQKQRLELENKALAVGLTTKTSELELLKSEFDQAVQQKDMTIENLTFDLNNKDAQLKKANEEAFSARSQIVDIRVKYEQAAKQIEILKQEMELREVKCLQLQQANDKLKQFTAVYMQSLQKDVQKVVEQSTNTLVQEVEFYKGEYQQLKDFLHELRDMVRSRGPLQNWINALFPE